MWNFEDDDRRAECLDRKLELDAEVEKARIEAQQAVAEARAQAGRALIRWAAIIVIIVIYVNSDPEHWGALVDNIKTAIKWIWDKIPARQ